MSVVGHVIDSTFKKLEQYLQKGTRVLRHFHIEISIPPPPACNPTPSPKLIIFIFDSRFFLQLQTTLIRGLGGLTAFKQSCLMNEIVHKSARFIEVCQLLFVTDCSLKAKEILDTLTNTLF